MANNVSEMATDILGGVKEYYNAGQKVESLLFRSDPLLPMIPKRRVAGKYVPYPALSGWGGNVSGDFLITDANATANQTVPVFQVYPGKLFGAFTLSNTEYLSTKEDAGAFLEMAIQKSFAVGNGMRKVLAKAQYGKGYGELGQLSAAVNAGDTTFTCDLATSVALTPGVKFQVTATASLTAADNPGGPFTVTSIDESNTTATVTFAPACPVGGWLINSYIILYGGRDASLKGNLPVGLDGWIPYTANRSGATWTTEIGTTFYNVDRSKNTAGLAGNFVLRTTGSEKHVEALGRGIKACRRGGGEPNIIVMNDQDYMVVINELAAQTTYFQSINTGDKDSKNDVVRGISDMKYAFSTSFVGQVIDSPYCPRFRAYILDLDHIEFIGLTNTEQIAGKEAGGPSGNEPGKAPTSSGMTPSTNYQFLIDDYYTTTPCKLSDGPGVQINLNLLANWVVKNPITCCVVNFVQDTL